MAVFVVVVEELYSLIRLLLFLGPADVVEFTDECMICVCFIVLYSVIYVHIR